MAANNQKSLELSPYLNTKSPIMQKRFIQFLLKWYAVLLAFICLIYSVSLGLMGQTDEALYTAHWPGTILLFSIAIRQRRTPRT